MYRNKEKDFDNGQNFEIFDWKIRDLSWHFHVDICILVYKKMKLRIKQTRWKHMFNKCFTKHMHILWSRPLRMGSPQNKRILSTEPNLKLYNTIILLENEIVVLYIWNMRVFLPTTYCIYVRLLKINHNYFVQCKNNAEL